MRILVTLSLLIGTAALAVACKPFQRKSSTEQQRQQGDQALVQAAAVEKELAGFNLSLLVNDPKQDYNWQKRSKAERQEMKRMLARYLTLSNTVLELDARKGLYLIRKDEVVAKRNAATERQRSLEDFERVFGENYEPSKDAGSLPDYVPAHDI